MYVSTSVSHLEALSFLMFLRYFLTPIEPVCAHDTPYPAKQLTFLLTRFEQELVHYFCDFFNAA